MGFMITMEEFEELYDNCDEIIYTNSMDDRKLKFIEVSDVFIIAPGGIGTLDEFFEVITLKKLKKHDKPIIILNVNHFFDIMLNMLNTMVEERFIDDEILFTVADNVEDAVELFN